MKDSSTQENIQFNDLKSTVQREIRKKYNKYIEDLIETNLDRGNKKHWGMVKSIKRDSSGVGPLKENGNLISDPLSKANLLNKQFQSVFHPPNDSSYLPTMGPSLFNPMANFQISENCVLKLLKNFKIHKAPGQDRIVPEYFFADQLAAPLTFIFQKSLDSSIVPSDWQQANVPASMLTLGQRWQWLTWSQCHMQRWANVGYR